MVTNYQSHQRVAIFVDVQNMFYSAKHLRDSKINYGKLLERGINGRKLVRAICYLVDTPETDQTNFIEMLENNGYQVKIKPLRVRGDGSSKGDWDMGIAIDAISISHKVDNVVLVSGDGDFIDLVVHLQSRGVFVEAISFPKSTNDDLITSVDKHIPIEKDLLIPIMDKDSKSYQRKQRPAPKAPKRKN
ncbi:MAG: NYN domain-containing protein [Candidatus Margulisbacteria bacterium]|nr:NYN domain-containing protein [Candidatus Margulisiibacteriota bacterium]